MDIKDKIADTDTGLKEQAKGLPVNAKYALYHGKTKGSEGVRDFTSSMTQTRTTRGSERKEKEEQRRKTIAERRAEMEQAKERKSSAAEPRKATPPVHGRPATNRAQGKSGEPMESRQTQTARATAQVGNAGRPMERLTGKSSERPTVSTAKEQTVKMVEMPPVRAERQTVKSDRHPSITERQNIKAEVPSERTERQTVQVSSRSERQSVSGSFPHSERPQTKAAPHAPSGKEPQRQSVKEHASDMKQESGRREKSRAATTAPAIKEKGQKK